MGRTLVFYFLCLTIVNVYCVHIRSIGEVTDADMRSHFQTFQDLANRAANAKQKHGLRYISIECGLCGIVMNEIEGLLIENITEAEMEKTLRNDICSVLSGPLALSCDALVDLLPKIIEAIEAKKSVSVICVNLGLCSKPFTPYPDPQPVPQHTLNLDLPPNQRWTEICSDPQFQNVTQYLVAAVSSVLPDGGAFVESIGKALNDYYLPKEYAQEIQGCAASLGISYGWATLMNMGYELSDDCTSIVAQTEDNKIYHARNLDFGEGMGFTSSLRETTIEIAFQKGGQTVYQITTFPGFVGILSGIKGKSFSMTLNMRFYPGGIGELFYEVVAAIVEKNASLVTFLARDVFENENTYGSALKYLTNGELIADVYYILAGPSSGQGAVITRNRNNATDVWELNAPQRWFEVQTNYDHWTQPPWYDDRVVPAERGMNSMGRSNLSLDNMFKVLTIRPVFNLLTTYTILACPADGSYTSFKRYCAYPCSA